MKSSSGRTSKLALYRKLRPLKLSDVIGQNHVTESLARAIALDQLSHAYLFTGPRGVGKTSIARIFAHEINKLDYKNEGFHLDIIEIDAASNRKIEDIRDLREKVNIAPNSAKYKVYIIDEVHMLTNESFNALLKTLEEPPIHVIFILATTDVHKLPATILSRVQRYNFKLVDDEEMKDYIQKVCDSHGFKIDPGALKMIIEAGGGSVRDTLSILDQIALYGDGNINEEVVAGSLGISSSSKLKSLIEDVKTNNISGLITKYKEIIYDGANPERLAIQIYQELKILINSDNVEAIGSLLKPNRYLNPSLDLEFNLVNIAQKFVPNSEVRIVNTIKGPKSKSELKKTTRKDDVNIVVKDLEEDNSEIVDDSQLDDTKNDVSHEELEGNNVEEVLNKSKNKAKKVNFTDLVNEIKKKSRVLASTLLHGKLDDNNQIIVPQSFYKEMLLKPDNYKLLTEVWETMTDSVLKINVDSSLKSKIDKKIKPASEPDRTKDVSFESIIDLMGGGESIAI
jgi:DNA polymerase-3 subunit gamma/tau